MYKNSEGSGESAHSFEPLMRDNAEYQNLI